MGALGCEGLGMEVGGYGLWKGGGVGVGVVVMVGKYVIYFTIFLLNDLQISNIIHI